MRDTKLIALYNSAIQQEAKLAVTDWSYTLSRTDEVYGAARQLLEVGHLGLVQRSYVSSYHLSDSQFAYSSVSSHTNIMATFLDRALSFECDEHAVELVYGYSYRELLEAARRHDLPENVIGDIPDNGERDNDAQALEEQEYWIEFGSLSPTREMLFEEHVLEILKSMNTRHDSAAGDLLHLTDKYSALIEVLSYDKVQLPPIRAFGDPNLSKQDLDSMLICDRKDEGFCKASEMWTATYFKQRELNKLDRSGFLTAVVIMATILVNHRWYKWRQKDYIS